MKDAARNCLNCSRRQDGNRSTQNVVIDAPSPMTAMSTCARLIRPQSSPALPHIAQGVLGIPIARDRLHQLIPEQ
ncbi:MAG TPA: hypothetical protein VKP13_18215, partial [Nitrospira sp.]|nr:hypothetical protein [Nitrospira sp.]